MDNADTLAHEGADPELLALPAPPRGRRWVTLGLMVAVIATAGALMSALRSDLAYYFADATIVDLGEATQVAPEALVTNRHVAIHGTPMLSRTVRFRQILSGSEYVVFPLAGQRTIYVQAASRPDTLTRHEFAGRLVRFSDLGARASDVEAYLARDLSRPASHDSYLLLADEPPESYLWSVLLAGLCALFIGLNLVLLFRWFRPLAR